MVELGGGGPDGPIEHGFSNTVFVVAAAIFVPVVGTSGIACFGTAFRSWHLRYSFSALR